MKSMKTSHNKKQLVKQIISVLLMAVMLLPDVTTLTAYGAEWMANRPRYVDFGLSQGLTLSDLGLATGSNSGSANNDKGKDELPDYDPDAPIPDEDEMIAGGGHDGSREVHISKATNSNLELREPEFFYENNYEEPDGELVLFTDKGRVYLMEENVGENEDGEPINSYITVIGKSSAIYRDEDGFIREYDNSLVPVENRKAELSTATGSNARARSLVTGTKLQNAGGKAVIQIPDAMDRGNGYLISDGEHTIEVIPKAGDFANSMTIDNVIRYTDVFENIDFQYTILGDSVKEDILLLEPGDKYEFSYQLRSDGLKFKKMGETIVAYDKSASDPVFRITAPIMIDAEGRSSKKIGVKFNRVTNTMTFTADKDWLEDETRSYPVRIDPGAELVGYDAFNLNMIARGDTEELAGNSGGARFDQSVRDNVFGDNGLVMVGYTREYGHCRALISIDTAWESLIDHEATKVDGPGRVEVQFSIGTITSHAAQRTPFILSAIQKDWNSSQASFNKMENDRVLSSAIRTGPEAYTEGSGSRVEFDITDVYYKWLDGSAPRNGLILETLEESEYDPNDINSVFWADAFYGRGGGPDNGPKLEVAWSGNLGNVDLTTMSMADFSLEVGPGVIESDAGGRSTRGILAHGASQADSTVDYQVYQADGSEVASGSVTAHSEVDCPDYTEVDSDCIPAKYMDSNWQSDPVMYEDDLELDTIYYVKAKGTGQKYEENPETGELESVGEEESEEKTSDEFLLYEVQATDLVVRIARHYGVTLKQIKQDNLFVDQLTVAGDVLFIRNPQTDEPYTRQLTPDQLEELLLQCLLEGKDPRCAFDMEPINMSNGSFYMAQTDAELEDLGGAFSIERSYNSITPYFRSEFGMGWNSLMGEKIMVLQDGTIIYMREDGKGLVFDKTGNRTYKAPDGYDYELKAVDTVEAIFESGSSDETEDNISRNMASDSNAERTGIRSLAFAESEDDENEDDQNEDDKDIEAVPASTGWEISQPDGTVKIFNAQGLLVTEKDRRGYKTSYVYDSGYSLVKMISPGGKEFGITQTEKGLITNITLPNGGELIYEYDENDDLVSVTNPEGSMRRYEYDENHHMTAWYDEIGSRIVLNTYDDKGRVVSQEDALGSVSTLQYEEGLTIATDNRGNETRYYQDEQNRNIRIVYANGESVATAYSEDNRITAKTSELGMVTKYTYDENGNVLTEKRGDGSASSYSYNELNLPLTATDYEGHTTAFTYDEAGNLLSMTDGAGNITRYTYDELHRLIAMKDANGNMSTFTYEGEGPCVSGYTDGEGNRWTFTYNEMNQLVSTTDSLGHTKTTDYNLRGWSLSETDYAGVETSYLYDEAGCVKAITDGNGVTTSFTYDRLYHILSGEDALGQTLTYTYDKNYNRITERDAKGNLTARVYDVRNREVKVRDALGQEITYSLDGAGNRIAVTDKKGNLTELAYHPVLGVPVKVVNALGHTTSYAYDRNGNLLSVTYPDGGKESFTYDGAGRMITQTARNGLVTKLSYDGNGNIVRITDDETRVYRFAYNSNNQLTETKDPLGYTTTYTYDGAGNQISITDANTHTTGYAYDAVGRLGEVTDALSGMAAMTYDNIGNVLSITDQNGHTTEYVRDTIGQVLAEVNAEGHVTAMEYDEIGNVTRITDALKGETALSLDALSRTVKQIDAMGGEYTYLYDANGNLLKITLPDEDTISMSYDKGNRLTHLRDEADVVTRYEYDSMGRMVKAIDTIGNVMEYEYDVSGNLIKQTDTIGRSAIYTYDRFNRLIEVTGTDLATTKYAYDVLDRLVSVTLADGTVTTYEYDGVGNLIAVTQPGEAIYTYAYDAINRLSETVNPLGAATTFRYDGKGNLTGRTDGEGNTTAYVYDKIDRLTVFTDGRGNETVYEYDALSRLLGYQTPEGNKEEYRYDALGRLTKAKDPNELITEYKYDVMGNLLSEISPKGLVTGYTYDKHDELTGIKDPSGNQIRYEVDLNRRVTAMTQKNGGTYSYTYDPVHRLKNIRTPLGYERQFTYDVADNIIKETDNLDRTSSYEYDIMHRMTRAVDPKGGITTYGYDIRGNENQVTNALGYTWNYEYDLVNQLTAGIDPEGKATAVVYNLVGEVKAVTRPGERTTGFTYDGNYNNTMITDPKGYVYQYTYDKDNRLTEVKDPLSQTETITYDAGSRVTSVKDKMGLTEDFTYDPHGNVLSIKATNGLYTRYSYDVLDNLIKVTMPSGLTASYTYDVMGNVMSATDTMKRTTKYTYDIEGNMTSLTNAEGRTETFNYDIAGRITEYQSPGGNQIAYDYDKLNDLIEKAYQDTKDPDGLEGVRYGYDALGQRIAMMDRSGENTYEYDKLGRIIKVTTGSGEVTQYAYDGSDQLKSITYPDGKKVSYEYDKNDNLTRVVDRDGSVTTYEYDSINRITEIHRPNGVSTFNTYNARNQIVVLRNICDDCEWVLSEYNYTYDDRGFIVGEDVVESLYAYAWDDKHDGKHENGKHDSKYPHGGQHNGKHEKDGEYKFQIIGTKRTFTYDDDGKLLSATEEEDRQGTYHYTFQYDDMGNRTFYSKTRNGKVAESAEYTYNDSNQMTDAKLYDGKKKTNMKYEYDADGNQISENGKVGTDKVELTYIYTVENRLKAIYDADELLVAMSYDGDGNRIFQLNYNLHSDDDWKGNNGNGNGNNKDNSGSGNSGNGSGSTGTGSGNNGNNGNGNNGNGNSGNDENGSGETGNTGNTENNSSTGTPNDNNGNANGNTNNTGGSQNQSGILFPIDGEVSALEQELVDMIKTTGKHKNYELIEYVNDVNREHVEVLQELNINGIMDTSYTYGNERLTNERFTGEIAYYNYDPRGSVTGLTDEGGMLRQSYRYDPFGGISFGKPQYNNIYAYNAENYNGNTEHQYLRARYYDTDTADFLTEDSYLGRKTDPLSLNRYNYVKSSPLNYIDPSGHSAEKQSSGNFGLDLYNQIKDLILESFYGTGSFNMELGGNKLSVSMEKASGAGEANICEVAGVVASLLAGFAKQLREYYPGSYLETIGHEAADYFGIEQYLIGKFMNQEAYYLGKTLCSYLANILTSPLAEISQKVTSKNIDLGDDFSEGDNSILERALENTLTGLGWSSLLSSLGGAMSGGKSMALAAGGTTAAVGTMAISIGGIVIVVGGVLVSGTLLNTASGKDMDNNLEKANESKGGGTDVEGSGKHHDELQNIASKYGDKECVDAADEMQKYLESQGQQGERWQITGGTSQIWSDTANDYISTNGVHHGIYYDGRVYDNIHKSGLTPKEWLNDFVCAISADLSKVPFP